MRLALATAILAGSTGAAFAMMPTLTAFPAVRTAEACQRWAAAQDDDAITMWGLMESGKTSDEVGRLRLALSCLGDQPPEIINFGSSVGAADQFCRHKPRAPICRERR